MTVGHWWEITSLHPQMRLSNQSNATGVLSANNVLIHDDDEGFVLVLGLDV
jgi:hypothetical protein